MTNNATGSDAALDLDQLEVIADRLEHNFQYSSSDELRVMIAQARAAAPAATEEIWKAEIARLKHELVVAKRGNEMLLAENDRLSQQPVQAAGDYVLMPRKLTAEMASALHGCKTHAMGWYEHAAEKWAAILAAAPVIAAPTAPTDQPKDTPESMANSNARFAIDGAIAFGREGVNKPPSEDHWLYEYWSIGQQLAKLGETSGWDNVTPLSAPTATAEPVAIGWITTGDIEYGSEGAEIGDWDIEWNRKLIDSMPEFCVPETTYGVYLAASAPQQAAPLTDAPGAHHLTAENVAAIIKDLREIEDGTTERPIEGRDWRTWAGVLARVIEWLSAGSAASAGDATTEQDAARYRELRRGQKWSVIDGMGDVLRAEQLDEAIDRAAMAATKEKKNG